jgi:transcriptional regulator with XRE-family HTH domain
MRNTPHLRIWITSQLARKRWTQAELARETGADTSTVSRILSGQTRELKPSIRDALCRVFGVTLETLEIVAGIHADPNAPTAIHDAAGIYWPALTEWARSQPHLVQAALLAVARSHGFQP